MRKTVRDRLPLSLMCCIAYHKGHRQKLLTHAYLLYEKCIHVLIHTDPISLVNKVGTYLHIDFHVLDNKGKIINNPEFDFDLRQIFVRYNSKQMQFELVQRPELYMRHFTCSLCYQPFTALRNLQRHAALCPGHAEPDIRYKDKEGIFRQRMLVFEKLRSCGINLSETQCISLYRKYYCCYDSESYYFKANSQENRMNTAAYQFKGKHHMFFLVAADNIRPSEKYACSMFYPKHSNDLAWIDEFIEHLLHLARMAKNIYLKDADSIFKKLRELQDDAIAKQQSAWLSRLEQTETALLDYYSTLPVYSYFGSFFDLNLGRTSGLFSSLERLDPKISCLKKGTKYIVLRSAHLIFYDITLLSGCRLSYKAYLQKYKQDEEKAELPYKIFQSYKDLKRPLPEYEDFEDELRLTNSLNYDYEMYLSALQQFDGNSQAALKLLGRKEVPLPGPIVYQNLQKQWSDKGFSCLMDLLKYYCYQVSHKHI